jgi:serine/threonine protein phosphatase PrpC
MTDFQATSEGKIAITRKESLDFIKKTIVMTNSNSRPKRQRPAGQGASAFGVAVSVADEGLLSKGESAVRSPSPDEMEAVVDLAVIEDIILPEVTHSASSDTGVGLVENEDAYSAFETSHFKMFMLADGTGGAVHGRDTALRVLSSLQFSLHQKSDLGVDDVRSAIQGANTEVLARAAELEKEVRIGSTLVGIGFTASYSIIFNVGNTRLFRIRKGEVLQLTVDHTVEGQLRRGKGENSPLPSGSRPPGHLLTSALGLGKEIEIYVTVLRDQPCVDDIYLLCTDGLYDVLTEVGMATILTGEGSLKRVVRRVVSQARNEGSTDNITALALKIDRVPALYARAPKVESAVPVVTKGINSRGDTREDRDSFEMSGMVPGSSEEAKNWLEEEDNEVTHSANIPRDADGPPAPRAQQERSQLGRSVLAGGAAVAENGGKAMGVSEEQKRRLNAAFTDNSAKRSGALKSVRGSDPFANISPPGAAKKGGILTTKSFPFPGRSGSSPSPLQFIVITLVAIGAALFAASFIASQFHFDEYLKGRETTLARNGGGQPTSETKVVRAANGDDLFKDEAQRLFTLASQVKESSQRFQFKELLTLEPKLEFDRIRNFEIRNLMLNVYAAIQMAVIQGQERIDKLAEHTERLNESISKLSLEVDRLEEIYIKEGSETSPYSDEAKKD